MLCIMFVSYSEMKFDLTDFRQGFGKRFANLCNFLEFSFWREAGEPDHRSHSLLWWPLAFIM